MATSEMNNLVASIAQCIHACEQCAVACLAEKDVTHMRNCIATDRDCADICSLTLNFLSRESRYWTHLLQLCVQVCQDCETECSKHAMDHCQRCADACRRCAEVCENFMHAHMA